MEDIANDIKAVLEFYQALGFERLPIRTGARGKGQGAKGKESLEFGVRSSEQNRIKRHASHVLSSKTNPFLQRNNPPIPPLEKGGKGGFEKQAALDALRAEIGDCRLCKLFKGRKNLVFGEGSPDADLMFIGEGPGREEDLQGRPFVGEAGQLLTKLIEKMGFKREDVYIGNIVKCRPPLNRDPEEDEINACLQFIEKQVEIISPKVIMSLGRISSHALTGTNIPITKLRGHFYEYKGIPLMPTFHPAYLLRNRSDKVLTWNDALKVLEKLGI